MGSLLVTVASLHASVAHAHSGPQEYRLPAGELGTVLNALAEQGGIQILYDAALLAGRSSSGLSGRYSVAAALRHAVRGSGLEIATINERTYVVRAGAKKVRAVVAAPRPRQVRAVASTELASVYVTGMRQPLSLSQSAMPVTEISREQIDVSGYASLFDLLKAQPGMQVSNQPEAMASDSVSSFRTGASGAAAVELRRLGANSTLFLVDGRRVAGYGLVGSAGTVVDLSGISLTMVERIEIMRDGASAIYGADAIAGVVNIILRRNFSGREVELYSGVSSRGDAATQQVAARWGAQSANGIGTVFGVNYSHSDPLPGANRDWYSLDQRRQGLLDLRDPYSNPGNQVYFDESTGQFEFRARPGCAAQDLSEEGACVLDSAKYTTLRTGKVEKSVFGRIEAPFGDTVDGHIQLRLSELEQRQQAGPPGVTFPDPAPDPDDPPSGPYPWGITYAYTQLGPAKETTQARLASVGAGLRGAVGDWGWDVYASIESNRVRDRIDGLLRTDTVMDALERIADKGAVPAGPPLDVVASGVTRHGRTSLHGVSASTAGPLFDLPGGSALLNAGLEVRRDSLSQQPDALLQSGELLNQDPEYPLAAQRSAAAAFVKLDLPLRAGLQADLAGRIDRSDGFAARFSPTLGLRWNPTEALLLRASASAGYRAPSLLELHQPAHLDGDAWVVLPSAAGPCQVTVIDLGDRLYCQVAVRYNNRGLRAETSLTTAYGLIWAPSRDFSLSADVYRSVRKDEIADLPLGYALDSPQRFPDLLQRNEAGEVMALNAGLVNIGRTITHGLDVELRRDLDVGRFGRLRAHLGANYLLSLQRRALPDSMFLELAGYADQPRLTAVASLRWSWREWIAGLNLRYTGGYAYPPYAGAALACPQYKAALGKCATPAFILTNLNLTWQGAEAWSVTAAVNNVFDHTPRYYDESRGGFNALFDDVAGRYYSLRATYRF